MSDKTLLERARYWIVEDIAAGAEKDEEHLLLIAELCDALEGVVGSWQWARRAVLSGKRIRRGNVLWIGYAVSFDGRDYRMHRTNVAECPLWSPKYVDEEATDWQLAEESKA